MNNLNLAYQLMGYGLLGVFITLVLFIVLIEVLVRVFPHREEE